MTRRLLVLLGLVVTLLGLAAPASAHPLGNFTVNTADRLVLLEDGLEVTHVVDSAEIPTVQLTGQWDTDGDQRLSPAELAAYADADCAAAQPLLRLTVAGADVPLALVGSTAETRPGAAGLTTTRLECTLETASLPRGPVTFSDDASAGRTGWREVTAAAPCGSLTGADVPERSPTGLLTAYPGDESAQPLDVRTATFTAEPGPCSGSEATTDAQTQVLPRGVDRLTGAFTDFLGRPSLTVPFALVSLLAAIAFGVLHAVAPGHGKTVMAAYLVGQRGSRRQALQLGAVVTFTHTASVLLLGALLALGALASPERVVPVTEVVSGVLLAVVGAYLLVLAVRRLRATGGHDHPHDHGHDHDHPHDHDHGHEPLPGPAPVPAGGVALAPRPVAHSHGGRAHTHAPLPEGPLSWRALAGMGVAGGLVPSPSALLVLLGATYLGRAWFGVVLVVAYGLGMAITLTAAGLLLLRAQALVEKRGWSGGRALRLWRLVPLVAACVVVLVGAGLVVRGLLTNASLG